MNEKIIAAQPPFFSETHAATIADAAREYPDRGWAIDSHPGTASYGSCKPC